MIQESVRVTSTRRAHTTLLGLDGLSALFLVYGALILAIRAVRPVPLRYDDGFFLLVSYSWKNGLGFNNPWIDLIGSGIYNWHGFLQPLVVSAISPCGSLYCATLGIAFLGAAFIITWLLLVNSITRRPLVRGLLYLIGLSSVLMFSARPELLAGLLSLFGAALYLLGNGLPPFVRSALAGVTIGAIAVTHPAGGIMLSLAAGAGVAWVSRRSTNVAILVECLVLGLFAAAGAATLLLATYPFEPMTWINGILQHGSEVVSRTDTTEFLKYYVGSRQFPGLLLIFVSLVTLLWLATRVIWAEGNAISRVVFSVAVVGLAASIWRFGIRVPATYYNVALLVPVISLAVAQAAESARVGRWSRLALVLPLAAFAAGCLATQVVGIVQKVYFSSDYDELAAEIRSQVEAAMASGKRVAMDPPLAIAIDDPQILRQVVMPFFGYKGKLGGDLDADILFRAETEFWEPPQVQGFHLVKDRFETSTLGNFIKPEALSYAVYEANAPEPAKQ